MLMNVKVKSFCKPTLLSTQPIGLVAAADALYDFLEDHDLDGPTVENLRRIAHGIDLQLDRAPRAEVQEHLELSSEFMSSFQKKREEEEEAKAQVTPQKEEREKLPADMFAAIRDMIQGRPLAPPQPAAELPANDSTPEQVQEQSPGDAATTPDEAASLMRSTRTPHTVQTHASLAWDSLQERHTSIPAHTSEAAATPSQAAVSRAVGTEGMVAADTDASPSKAGKKRRKRHKHSTEDTSQAEPSRHPVKRDDSHVEAAVLPSPNGLSGEVEHKKRHKRQGLKQEGMLDNEGSELSTEHGHHQHEEKPKKRKKDRRKRHKADIGMDAQPASVMVVQGQNLADMSTASDGHAQGLSSAKQISCPSDQSGGPTASQHLASSSQQEQRHAGAFTTPYRERVKQNARTGFSSDPPDADSNGLRKASQHTEPSGKRHPHKGSMEQQLDHIKKRKHKKHRKRKGNVQDSM